MGGAGRLLRRDRAALPFLDAHPNLDDLAQPNRENLDEWGFADELRGGVMHSTAAVLAALGVPQQEIDELIETWGPR